MGSSGEVQNSDVAIIFVLMEGEMGKLPGPPISKFWFLPVELALL